MKTITRNGKIARLPWEIREQLNRRLRDGEQGKKLVSWLNDLPDVADYMDEYFDGRPFNEQNLTEWKQGGHQDWLHHQENMEMARSLVEDGDRLTKEAGYMALSDRVAPTVALALTKMIRSLTAGPLDTPELRREALVFFRELALLREGDHKAARINMTLKQQDENEKRKVEEKVRDPAGVMFKERIGEVFQVMQREQMIRLITQNMTSDLAQYIRNYVQPSTSSSKRNGCPAPITPDQTQSG